MLLEILGVVAPVFLIAGIGYLLEKGGAGLHHETMSTLVMTAGAPALIFSSLTSTELSNSTLASVSAGALGVAIIGAGLSLIVLAVLRLPVRNFLPSLTMPNAGNIGLPCAYLAFGADGLALGAAFFFVNAILLYTVMPILSRGSFSLDSVFREPLVWAVVAAIVFRLSGMTPPGILADTTEILGGMMIPIMVILLGGTLARLKVSDVGVSVRLGVARLLIGVSAGTLVVTAFRFRGIEAGTVFLLASMPAATVTYVFAQRYDRSPEQVAGLIVTSTVLVFLALPAILFVAISMSSP
ncbi:AEC family transporter [bacterium AH-315-O15]|nr:AEC family transporter [bacterium AH-315-O15]